MKEELKVKLDNAKDLLLLCLLDIKSQEATKARVQKLITML